jgi:hypothetical protein
MLRVSFVVKLIGFPRLWSGLLDSLLFLKLSSPSVTSFMKKVFVLDTNVLLHDPMAMFRFEDNDVILPITIIEELDRFKKGSADTGVMLAMCLVPWMN